MTQNQRGWLVLVALFNAAGAVRNALREDWVWFTVCACIALAVTILLLQPVFERANQTIDRILKEHREGR